jgi:hypothetical protein
MVYSSYPADVAGGSRIAFAEEGSLHSPELSSLRRRNRGENSFGVTEGIGEGMRQKRWWRAPPRKPEVS